MIEKDLIDLAYKYINCFAKKDLNQMKSMFERSIILRDWELNVIGSEEILEINKSLFNKVREINVEIINIMVNKNYVAAELIISFDKNEAIKVVDIIEFSEDRKIKSIRAYKG